MKKSNKIFSRIVVIVTIMVLLGLSVKALEVKKLIKEKDKELVMRKKELQQHEEQLKNLQNELKHINTKEYIEKVAREQLGLVKEDDIIFKEKP